jgi:transposase-like protein
MPIFKSTPVVMGEGQGEYVAAGKPSGCPTGKKCHATEEQAKDFAGFQLRKFGTVQRPYKCDQCTSWHLTSNEVGDHTIAKADLADAAKNDAVNHRGETTEKVRLMLEKGMSVKQIAAELGITAKSVYYHVRKLNGAAPNPRKADSLKATASVTTLSYNLEALAQEEKELAEKLAAVQAQRQRLIEFRTLKVCVNGGGRSLHIQKEGEHMDLPAADIAELIEKLEEIVTAPAQHGLAACSGVAG